MSTGIEQAQQALKAKREAGEIEYLNPTEKAIRNPESLKAAINAMCYECVGRDEGDSPRKTIAECSGWSCPLWSHRPHQHLVDDTYGHEQRTEAVAAYPPRTLLEAAGKDPASRRKAIRAKCHECMGGDRKLISACTAEFPLDRGNGHHGCPLWRRRPTSR